MTMLMSVSTVGIYTPNVEQVNIAGSMSEMAMFRQSAPQDPVHNSYDEVYFYAESAPNRFSLRLLHRARTRTTVRVDG
jgi:hypothetical protein